MQHRDTLRYAPMRGGVALPLLRRFNVGDYVYHRNNGARNSLEAKAKSQIYRAMEIRPTAVIVLEIRCGSTIKMHVSHCAP